MFTQLSNPQLAPCPFCGKEATITPHWAKINVYVPECEHCGACIDGDFATEDEAIEAWNARASCSSI